ncbi:hypothetical protein SRHO_G00140460 [Serrasalmus rhombeus]
MPAEGVKYPALVFSSLPCNFEHHEPASEDPQPLNLALPPQSFQHSNPPAAGPVLENPGLGKKFKASTQGAAPTPQAALRRANEENAALKVKSLEEKVTLLEDDKQFPRQSLSEALVIRKAASGGNTQAHISSSDSSEDEDSSYQQEKEVPKEDERICKEKRSSVNGTVHLNDTSKFNEVMSF